MKQKERNKKQKRHRKIEKIKDVKIKLSFTIHAKHIKHIETLQIYSLFFSFFLLRRVSFILDQNSLILSIGEGCSIRGCKTVSKSSKRMKPTHHPSRRFSIPLQRTPSMDQEGTIMICNCWHNSLLTAQSMTLMSLAYLPTPIATIDHQIPNSSNCLKVISQPLCPYMIYSLTQDQQIIQPYAASTA